MHSAAFTPFAPQRRITIESGRLPVMQPPPDDDETLMAADARGDTAASLRTALLNCEPVV